MIPFKLGDFSRRAFCFALAFLLALNVPLSAYASVASQSQTVGWAETVSSFLMASGVYPYSEDEQEDFDAWSLGGLSDLWGQFSGDVADVGYDIVDMTGTLAKGLIDISTGRWNALRAFSTWLVNKYDVGDNQTGVEIGGNAGLAVVPSIGDSSPSLSLLVANGLIYGKGKISHGTYAGEYSGYVMASSDSVFAGYYRYSSDSYSQIALVSDSPFTVYATHSSSSGTLTYSSYAASTLNGVYFSSGPPYTLNTVLNEDIPLFPAPAQNVVNAFLGGQIAVPPLLSANTTTVSVPPALPETAESGGISVVGAGASVSVSELEGVIQAAVTAALKPQIEVVLPDSSSGSGSGSDVQTSAPAFPQVDYPQVVSIFLMASGIYPQSGDGQSFADWSVYDLVQLWESYKEDISSEIADVAEITEMTASLVQGNVVIDGDTWNDLRQFTEWIVNTYNLGDNESGVSLPVQDGVTGGSDVVVNTGSVTVPDALPEGQDFGGLPIPGVGVGGTVGGLADVIGEFVEGGLEPEIPLPPIKLDLGPDIELSPGGEIKPSPEYSQPVDIPDIPMTPGDYAAPDLTGLFPFSIPWDIMRVFDVLNAAPVRPDFEANVYIPVVDVHVPFHIGVTDDVSAAVDDAMALWRNMLLVLMCVGTLWLFWNSLR